MIRMLKQWNGFMPDSFQSFSDTEEARLIGLGYAQTAAPSDGFVGQITAENFGVNSIRYPLQWDDVTTGPVTRTGVAGQLAAATQRGNTVRIFFGLQSNGRGGAGLGPATGIFAPGTLNFSVNAGVGTGYQTNGAVSRLSMTIPVDTGTGTIAAGTEIEFDNDEYLYTVAPGGGITGAGSLTLTSPVQHDIGDNVPMRTRSRLNDLRYAIDVLHAAGLKVLICWEGPVPTDDAAMGVYRDQLEKTLRYLPHGANRQDTFIDFIEPSNEVFQQGASHERCAEMMRITATLFRMRSPKTKVLSVSYQGGESTGANDVLMLMAASAAGIPCPAEYTGNTGAGTTGEQWFDHLAYHPYIETIGTVAAARAALSSSVAQLRFKDFIDPIRVAFATRRAANPTYWSGRPDPEIHATEWCVNPNGGVASANADFRMQAFTPEERTLLIEQGEVALRACGVAKSLPYAVDHHFVLGPMGQLIRTAAPNGDLRVDTTGIAGPPHILDGDELYASDGVGWCVAYNANAAGTQADLNGIAASSYSPYQSTSYRWQLGGWAEGYRAIQNKFIGYAEFGWHSSGVPQLQINRGQVFRSHAGRLTPVAVDQ